MFVVDKHVPLPDLRDGYTHYPFAVMEVGDSFFAATTEFNEIRRIRTQAHYHHRVHGKSFTVRQVPGGVRVWRCPDAQHG